MEDTPHPGLKVLNCKSVSLMQESPELKSKFQFEYSPESTRVHSFISSSTWFSLSVRQLSSKTPLTLGFAAIRTNRMQSGSTAIPEVLAYIIVPLSSLVFKPL